MSNYAWVFWDTETNGLDTRSNVIISLGAVATIYQPSTKISEMGKLTQKVVDEFHEFIHTDLDIQNQHIHHISNATLLENNAQPFANVLERFQTWLQSLKKPVILVSHNGRAFDEKILYCNMTNHDPPIPFVDFFKKAKVFGFLDSLVLFRNKQKTVKNLVCHPETKVPSLTLNIIHLSWCGYIMPDHHNALADAQALQRVFDTPSFKSHFKLPEVIQTVSNVQKIWTLLNQQTGIEPKRKMDDDEQQDHCKRQKTQGAIISEYIGDDNWKLCTQCVTFCSILDIHTCIKTNGGIHSQ